MTSSVGYPGTSDAVEPEELDANRLKEETAEAVAKQLVDELELLENRCEVAEAGKAPTNVKELHDSMAEKVNQVNVSFFAKVGNGKSSSANTLLRVWGYDGPPFEARRQRGAVTSEIQTIELEFKVPQKDDGLQTDHAETQDAEPQKGDADAQAQKAETQMAEDGNNSLNPFEERNAVVLRVTDQPGLMDANGHVVDSEHLRGTALSGEHQDGYNCIFIVEKITDRLDATEQIILRALKKFYGDAVCPHIVLLLTHSDVMDSSEEITRMVAEAQEDVERELGAKIFRALAINNHQSNVDAAGMDRARAGQEMIAAIHDLVSAIPEPFKPPEVDLDAVVWYVDQEVELNPSVAKESVLAAVLRFIPVIGKKQLCSIL
jgi:hypothetical protein